MFLMSTTLPERSFPPCILTDAGAALAREGQKLQSTCLDALFAGLTQSEAERFQELLEKVLTSAEVRLKEGGNT